MTKALVASAVVIVCVFGIAPVVLSGTVDFETPVLSSGENSRIIDPYIDPATGIVFTINPGCCGYGDEVVGLVTNEATSACVPPADVDQKLGTGRIVSGVVGFAGFLIRATFPEFQPSPAMVSVEFQALAGRLASVTLFSANGLVIGEGNEIVPAIGKCHSGEDRGRIVVTASSSGNQPIAYAVMSVQTNIVWVIDNFTVIDGGIIPTEQSTWGSIKALYSVE